MSKKAFSICPQCGREFSYYPSLYKKAGGIKVHCSRKCQMATSCARAKNICPQCGKEFWYYKSSYPKGKVHCSRRCQSKAARAWTTCPQCGKEFWYHRSWPRKYCSRKCNAAVNAKNNLGIIELPPMFCEECGKEITGKKCYKSRFCSLHCFGKWQSKHKTGPNHPSYKGGYDPYYGPNWRQQRRNARRRDDYTCQRCGITEAETERRLDVHHIIPFREFGIERYKEANKISNLISLCSVCHKTVEHNGL